MRWLGRASARVQGIALMLFFAGMCGLGGCTGSNTPGRMEWVQPRTQTPRVGTVYLIRGWSGIFSAGIDEMAEQLRAQGVTAHVFMPEQHPELAAAMVERYKGASGHEPICFVGHSRGVDSSIIISRELDKAGVTVDMIVSLDSVDETTVPKNVRICHNYWMPGVIGDTNLLRGIPLKQAPGSTGEVYNYHLDKEYRHLKEPLTDHVTIDDDPKLQKRIVGQLLEVCRERSTWQPPARGSVSPSPSGPQR